MGRFGEPVLSTANVAGRGTGHTKARHAITAMAAAVVCATAPVALMLVTAQSPAAASSGTSTTDPFGLSSLLPAPSAGVPATVAPTTPATTAASATSGTATSASVASSAPAGYGCGPALSYLAAHAAPEFTFECPGYSLGREAMTCVDYANVCPNEKIIVITDPCPQAYMNEASNSWVLTHQSSAPIDPYGACPAGETGTTKP